MFFKVKRPAPRFTRQRFLRALKSPFAIVYHNIGLCLRLTVIAFAAEPELQRELDYVLKPIHPFTRSIVLFVVNGIWRYAKAIQSGLISVLLLHRRKNVSDLWENIDGTTISWSHNNRLSIESTDGLSTAFFHDLHVPIGTFKVCKSMAATSSVIE
jgi:hypothetical protein